MVQDLWAVIRQTRQPAPSRRVPICLPHTKQVVPAICMLTPRKVYVVVAVVDDPFDEVELFFIGGRKEFHASREAIHCQEYALNRAPLIN